MEFNKRQARRIASAVKKVEGLQTSSGSAPFKRAFAQTVFAVRVKKSSGSAGSISTTCDFKYDCFLDSGDQLAEDVAPQKCRYDNVPYRQPPDDSWGLATYDKDGAFTLLEALCEIPDIEEPCE